MKSFTLRLPDEAMAGLEDESRRRNVPVADVVRECIAHYRSTAIPGISTMSLIGDLVGSVSGLPADTSANVKRRLRKTGYGKRPC